MDTLSRSNTLLRHHSPPSNSPWRIHISILSIRTHSPLGLLLLPKSLLPVPAQKFDFGLSSYDDDGEVEDYGGGKRSKRRRRRRAKRRQWFDERERVVVNQREQPSLLDEVVESLWFLKVLRSYGWFLPAIMISLLISTGPKAFLMAFSLPLGFSMLALAFNKLSAWLEGTPEPRQTRKTRSPFSMEEEYENDSEEEEEEIQPRVRAQKRRYRSQAARNNGPAFTGNSSSKFGGWDELISEEEEMNGTLRPDEKTDEQKIQEMNGSLRPGEKIDEQKIQEMNGSLRPDKTDEQKALGMNGSFRRDKKPDEQKTQVQEGPLSTPMAERELPLLLKLLVALFPFLGSWTSLL